MSSVVVVARRCDEKGTEFLNFCGLGLLFRSRVDAHVNKHLDLGLDVENLTPEDFGVGIMCRAQREGREGDIGG